MWIVFHPSFVYLAIHLKGIFNSYLLDKISAFLCFFLKDTFNLDITVIRLISCTIIAYCIRKKFYNSLNKDFISHLLANLDQYAQICGCKASCLLIFVTYSVFIAQIVHHKTGVLWKSRFDTKSAYLLICQH